MAIHLGNENVFELKYTVDEAQSLLENEFDSMYWEKLMKQLDETQSYVHSGKDNHAYLIIKISE